jgi:ferredoxin
MSTGHSGLLMRFIKAEFDCRVGNCGMCAVKVIEGYVERRDNVLSEADKVEGFMCTCVSRSISETLVLNI